MKHFLHTFNPHPILISIGPINIYWYGFFIVCGIILAILLTIKLSKYYPESNLNKDKVIDLAFWCVLFGILGARIYHVFLEFPYYLDNPIDIFKIWQGGLAIHGAIIGGIFAIWFFAKKITISENQNDQRNQRSTFWLLASIIAPSMALAQAIGRWGNYFNQENFGGPTSLPWGIPIDYLNKPLEYVSYRYFHPAFLYESIGNFIIFLILISIQVWIIKRKKQNNVMCYVLCVMCYAILYSLLRFFTEFIRIDQAPELFGLRWPQIMSIIIFIVSLAMLLKNKKNYANI